MQNPTRTASLFFNRIIYGILLAAAALSCLRKDLSSGFLCTAIAAAFDPFDPAIPFYQRPIWQRFWLGAHLVLLVALAWFSF